MQKNLLFFFLLLEAAIIICYGFFTTYDIETQAVGSGNENSIQKYYPFFQDVHVMIFVGFGFLMTFLHKYGFSAIGLNFMIAALTIQMSILINGFFHQVIGSHTWEKITLNIESLITGDFAAGAVLITLGALLGKVSPLQLGIIALLEVIVYAVNESIGVIEYQAVDMGGSMFVHTFGAFFGVACAHVLNTGSNKKKSRKENHSNYNSDLFAMIGTLFLWIYWPSFNGALATGNSQHRVVVNTVFALSASCLSAFVTSYYVRGKFDMVDIQNATLAGGVAVGSSADMTIGPEGALSVGVAAGFVSVLGYVYLSPWLNKKFNICDTCGVLNLHGIPGIMGGLGGVISALTVDNVEFGDNIGDIYPAMADGRDRNDQAKYQAYALATTLGCALVGGWLVGSIAKCVSSPKIYYQDKTYWEVPHEEDDNLHKENATVSAV